MPDVSGLGTVEQRLERLEWIVCMLALGGGQEFEAVCPGADTADGTITLAMIKKLWNVYWPDTPCG